jgi:endonuclease/exonuclease/phosphatase family metal-dependent hydrolase
MDRRVGRQVLSFTESLFLEIGLVQTTLGISNRRLGRRRAATKSLNRRSEYDHVVSVLFGSRSRLRARLGFGVKTSWPVPVPSFLRIPIDHCLLSDDFHVTSVEVGSSIGSDHLPLVVTASLKEADKRVAKR